MEQQQTLGTDVESAHARSLESKAATPPPTPPKGNKDQGNGKKDKTSAVGTVINRPNGHGAAVEHGHYGFGAVLDEPPVLTRGRLETLAKRAVPVAKIDPRAYTPQAQLALRRFEVAIHNTLAKVKAKTVAQLKRKLVKAKSDEDALLQSIIEQVAAEWELLPAEVEDLYTQAALGGVSLGSLQISITDRDSIDRANDIASQWARGRAAELVGMRRTATGELVANPNARWAITDSTRDSLRTVIRDLFQADSPTLRDVEDRIEQAGIFDDKRASMIARTEISMAQTKGNLTAWKQSEKVLALDFQLSGNHDHDDECDEAADNSPYALDDAGIPEPPLHPNCDCVLVLSEIEGDVEIGPGTETEEVDDESAPPPGQTTEEDQ